MRMTSRLMLNATRKTKFATMGSDVKHDEKDKNNKIEDKNNNDENDIKINVECNEKDDDKEERVYSAPKMKIIKDHIQREIGNLGM